ncbi:hypothetical protein AK812_SmicGene49073 [Symbiodinium microadriaticum]|uniref:Uncharacterized protein n=1 Tax=Symbiodinium microadriaticum TaxID=2951 RepID=A0A1Q9CZ00_SYMMI|nr:hypothetical protein AK812_SmicGene49073 [Symbiodinium microadriaticum]
MASRSDLVKKWLSKGGATPACPAHVASDLLLFKGYRAPEKCELERQTTSAVDFDLAAQSEQGSSSNSDLEGMYAFNGIVQTTEEAQEHTCSAASSSSALGVSTPANSSWLAVAGEAQPGPARTVPSSDTGEFPGRDLRSKVEPFESGLQRKATRIRACQIDASSKLASSGKFTGGACRGERLCGSAHSQAKSLLSCGKDASDILARLGSKAQRTSGAVAADLKSRPSLDTRRRSDTPVPVGRASRRQ